ncbi:MAG TPA: hypothetical protein VGL71_04845, partial [Urbifossiella sp.]
INPTARRFGFGASPPVVSVILAFVLLPKASAQPEFFEPTQGFYKARGAGVSATWSLDRETLPADGVLTATLTIRGATNPQEIVRPDLAKIRDDEGHLPYSERFQIEDVPGQPTSANAREVTFVYRLRPRNEHVDKLPSLGFYYDTGKKVGNPFQKTWAKGPKLTVTAAAKPKPAALPLDAPDRLFAIETGTHLLESEPFATSWIAWLLVFSMGPLMAAAWYAIWRRIYPDGVRLARLRRNRATRRALEAIRRAGRSADPAAALAAAVIGYLRTRYPLTPGVETPGEVGESLRDPLAGTPDLIENIVDFLRHCDEARFAPFGDNSLSLSAGAELLITRLEVVA